MAYEIVKIHGDPPKATAYIETGMPREVWLFGTGKAKKLAEYERILGRKVEGVSLENLPEIQSLDRREVAEAKAIAAWERNNHQPVIIEDNSISLAAWDGLPGTLTDQFTSTPSLRQNICDIAAKKGDFRIVAYSIFAVFDGNQVQYRTGEVTGVVPFQPQGNSEFDWDDIFMPDGQEKLQNWNGKRRTFAEMKPDEKDMLSMRARALEEMQRNPFVLRNNVFQLPEPYIFQTDAINPNLLKPDESSRYVHAYNIDVLQQSEGDISLSQTYHEIFVGDPKYKIRRYVLNPDQPDIGLIVTPMDTAVDIHNEPYRLKVSNEGDPIFWRIGTEATRMAVASRALEFKKFHNPEMYEFYRKMMRGEIVTPKSSHQRSEAIEELLRIERKKTEEEREADDDAIWDKAINRYLNEEYRVQAAAAFNELGHARQYSPDKKMSRTQAADTGLFVTGSGLPSSIFGLGGMPPVTGWADVVLTAALSMMDSYISHNSIFAGDFDRQMALFHKAVGKIRKLNLPTDIEELVIGHIGICIGSDDTKTVEKKIKRILNEGGSLVRFYTTNPDYRVTDAAEQARQTAGTNFLRICVGPAVDLAQGRKLRDANTLVNILLWGHGGGENCTSLEDGGAANALELAYLASLDPIFDDCDNGLEGAVGTAYGPLLRFIRRFSLNRRGVAGGIEAGGLYVEHTNGRIVQPYWGTASPATQWTEVYFCLGRLNTLGIDWDTIHESTEDTYKYLENNYPEFIIYLDIILKRIDEAGRLNNDEGKINHLIKARAINSIVDTWHVARMVAGRGLADQRARSVNELLEIVENEGHNNHRIVSPGAAIIAGEHRGKK